VVIETTADAEDLRRRYGRWIDVEALGGSRCRLTMDTDSFHWPTHVATGLEAPFEVIEPADFRDHLRAVAERLAHTSFS
jgi:predicted DNA-binding transcriptional regulator YafY